MQINDPEVESFMCIIEEQKIMNIINTLNIH